MMTNLSKTRRASESGFALVVTLSLMILLTMIAVGLLSLSSVALRISSQGMAQAEAQANARMALMIAIGELQKHAGPDKAVTATSGIRSSNPAKPHLTGVWESWDYDPTDGSMDYESEKRSRFRSWLVSAATPSELKNPDFATTPWNGETIELVGEASMGGSASNDSRIVAGKVPVSDNGSARGAYAWHVSDESVKTRINLYRDPSINDTLARKTALSAGHRPDPSVMTGPSGSPLDFLPNDLTTSSFQASAASVSKVTDLEQVGLLSTPGNAPNKIKPFRHDVTPYSLGLLTDVRHGGLKQDLTSIFEMASFSDPSGMPPEFAGRGLYETTHGIHGSDPLFNTDPGWNSLASYYNIHKVLENADRNPVFAQAPTGEQVADIENPEASTPVFPGPVIQKVEMMFTLLVRDTHPGGKQFLLPQYPYLAHIIFTPIITLHNPYNVSISFEKLKVLMSNIPASLLVYLDGRPINTRLLNLSYYFFQNHKGKSFTDFTVSIADWSNAKPLDTGINGPIVMKPGQSLVCSPYLEPNITYASDEAAFRVNPSNIVFKDTGRKAKPGYFGRCFGFDTDVIRPKHAPDGETIQTTSPPPVNTYLGIKGQQGGGGAVGQLKVEFAIKKPVTKNEDERFKVRAQVTADGRDYEYGGLNFIYSRDETFEDVFPEVYESTSFAASEAYVPNTEPISDHANAQTFAVFSAYARTTSGGVYDNASRNGGAGNSLRDGRIAGMPYLFHNPARPLSIMHLDNEKSGFHSHEMNVQPFYNLGQVEDYFNLDAINRTACLTGNTTQRGIKSGSYLELPLGPMQSIADFRRSNAIASPYLPNYVQPIANSRVSPILTTTTAKMNDPDVAAYDLLDHSFLANHALYDRFYFSTFATDGSLEPGDAFERFMNLEAPLPSQAYQPYLPAGKTVSGARGELFSGGKPKDGAYRDAAAYQMVKGPFNVNSTSIQAWKARLAATSKDKIVTLWAKSGQLEELTPAAVPVLPMALVNGGPVGGGGEFAEIDDPRTNDWNGYRELSDEELESLATSIVDEVRERGPFLSMSEFVNRRIGPESELTRMGALEAAIEDAGINEVVFRDQVPVTEGDLGNAKLYDFSTPLASVGNPAAGAPGWVSQGDLMRLLEPAATVRSDTFVIRTYGEARDTAGKVTATAYAEAVVQRLPEYLDGADRPTLNAYSDPGAAPVNKIFGRRFSIVSFRWLNQSEI
jgi:hypothetical protein